MPTNNVNKTLTLIISFLSGVIFSIGLIVSQMINPDKVISFLEIFHHWDPSLGLVMAGGIGVALPVFLYVKSRVNQGKGALNNDDINLPTATNITPELLIGSVLFGIGWGMLGLCPAPAVVVALAGYTEAILFVAALLLGMFLHSKIAD